jgi:hypothetical protein
MRKLLVAAVALLLAGCGDENAPTGGDAHEAVKLDSFCSVPGLKPALRETVLVVDRNAVKPAKPETFKTENAGLFAAVIGLADAERAISSGAMAPREHLTIAVADPKTGGLNPIFSGCLPGMSKQEVADAATKGGDGALAVYFGSDTASKLREASKTFLTKAVLMTVQISPAERGGGDGFETSSLARTFKAIGAGDAAAGKVRRLVVYSDPSSALAAVPEEYEAARKLGFELAESSHAALGMSEAYIIPAGKTIGETGRGFLDAWLLANGADLRFVGAFTPSSFSKPPVQLVAYTGELPLTRDVMSPMEMRLAAAADGSLVDSWISYTASKGIRRTPLSGQFACTADGCELRGDPDGTLGQRWRTKPGTQPQLLVDGPFGGMRLISGTDNGKTMKGRIYDPIILVGQAGGTGDIRFVAKRAN